LDSICLYTESNSETSSPANDPNSNGFFDNL